MKKESDQDEMVVRVHVAESAARSRAGWITCNVQEHLQFSAESLASYFFAQWEPVVFDALLLAAAAEFCDKIKRRSVLQWAREIHMRVPVHDPDVWMRKEVAATLH